MLPRVVLSLRPWCLAAVVVLASAFAFTPKAQAVAPAGYTVTDHNSSLTFNPITPLGNNSWDVDGVNVYGSDGKQWLWYSVGDAAPQSIDNLTLNSANVTANIFNASYTGAGFDLTLRAILSGGSTGSGISGLSETVTVNNTGTGSLPFHLYQYTDFNLPNNPALDKVVASGTPVNTFDQTGTAMTVAEVNVTPPPNEVEVNVGSNLLNLLNGSSPVTLNNDVTQPTGNPNFAMEWDPTIAPDSSFIVSINKTVTTPSVPLPNAAWASLATLALIAGIAAIRRLRLAAIGTK